MKDFKKFQPALTDEQQEKASSGKVVNPLPEVIGVEEAAEKWGLSAGYVKNLCAAGKVKAKKIGKTWVLDRNQTRPNKVK